MRRIEITYDFDPASFKYYEEGLNDYPSMQFVRNSDPFKPIEEIKKTKNIQRLNHLGTGLDKICIADSKTNKCFILEPCSAAYFICAMEETFNYFVNELKRGKTKIENGGICLDEKSYRKYREHKIAGDGDIWAGIHFELIDDKWNMSIGKVSEEPILTFKVETFLSAYFEFGEKMIRFYDSFIPQFKTCKFQYELFTKAIRNSIIKEEFSFSEQSSYDKRTYYDYQ